MAPTVLLTHAEGRLEGLAEALAARGFQPVHLPLIATRPLPVSARAARELLGCDWLLFTSRSAVAAWCALGLPLAGARPRLGAVGEATARELAAHGGRAQLVGDPPNAEGLLARFVERVSPPARVGLPCALDALPTLPEGLARAGFAVTRLPLYETVARAWPDTLTLGGAETTIIVLASPSAAAALPQTVGERARLVALGPSTERALAARGWRACRAPTPDVSGVTEAVLRAALHTHPPTAERSL
ncbi:uroporphyrinogen-III synthase [Truepera radiovictrix]|uniref:Uroporphyrinogen-III synthase n=1 Tax=Truepera radiovictrix (strain DSM 17093 / CIP 108686 / LMG 22925 / RQ-24) TaxID=649638 RepID=D7CY06_TRURR|nr:uroporphyrinogen-III synthase [Truepera radiovictrix]ADI13366.1 Uroporphyrinogen III synthase HEM4 [Truepera radiovictrix DSM 17093]WMT58071.1 uroporphyrinogen-III synthase [Truepera radiovictrix]